MASESWPNAAHNSGAVTTTEYEQMVFRGLGSGLVGSTSDTSVVYADGTGTRVVKIRAGKRAVVRGVAWYSGAADTSLPSLAENTSGSTRIDRVVLRLTKSTGVVAETVLQGTAGAGAPALTADNGTTGTWDLPLAQITVDSGATAIASNKVLMEAWFVGGQPIFVPNDNSWPASTHVTPGTVALQSDQNRVWVRATSGWALIYRDSFWITLPSSSGWTSGISQYRRLGNAVYVLWSGTRSGSLLPRNTDSTLAVLPEGFRPLAPSQTRVPTQIWTGSGVYHALVGIYPTGEIKLTDYEADIPTGSNVYMTPVPLVVV